MADSFDCAVTVPGRVNLIGEHIDYNGLPVLPIAIDRTVRIDFNFVPDPVVQLDNAVEQYAPFALRLDRPMRAAPPGHWSNYVRAAAHGLADHGIDLQRGIAGRVAGDIPVAAGLSSSSALVVAAALALLGANGVAVAESCCGGMGSQAMVSGFREDAPGAADRVESAGPEAEDAHAQRSMTRLELAALMARAERFVGLEGGGMDQAACLCGVAGHALRIEFDPLRVTPVAVPGGWRWVVASSLTPAEKSAGARDAYNERARQCRTALDGMRGAGGSAALSYPDLVRMDDLDGVLRHARRVLPELLLRRFRHVLTEGRRVAHAEAVMQRGDIRLFGNLMVQSHRSLRDDYAVSTPELDALVKVALEAGAAGARLTGAGFGGSAVALCDDATVGAVMEAMAERFYAPRLGRRPGEGEVFEVGVG